MRIKVYYPKSEITNNLYTSGKEWMLEDNTEYLGSYHKYTTGEVYTRSTWNATLSKKLIKFEPTDTVNFIYKELKPDVKTKFNSVNTYYPKITSQDRTKGFIKRFFLKKINSTVITEIGKKQYDEFNKKKIDPNMNISVTIQWIITGPKQDEYQGNILVPGVATQNKKSIQSAINIMPGIELYLDNVLQFYSDTEFIVPADINPK